MIWKKSLYSYLLVSRDSTFKHTQRRYIHPNHPCSCPSHTWANKCLNLCYGVSFSLRLPISPFVSPSGLYLSMWHNIGCSVIRWLYIYVGLEWYISDFLWGIVDSELEDSVKCSFVKIKLKKYDLQKKIKTYVCIGLFRKHYQLVARNINLSNTFSYYLGIVAIWFYNWQF